MSARATMRVAEWEFLRWVKPKQQGIGFVITLLMLLGFGWFSRRGDDSSVIEIAVVGAENLPTLAAEAGRFRFEPHDAAELTSLLAEVDAEERDAVLRIEGDGAGTLHTRQQPRWRDELARELTAAGQLLRLDRSGIAPETIAAISAPFELDVAESRPGAGRAERMAAIIAIVLVVIGLFSGIGYIFASVTGEKQNRLSEQIISMIPAQSWIDGKILGLAAVSVVAILNFIVAGLAYALIAELLWDAGVPSIEAIREPGLLFGALVFVTLGFLFWFAFLTACAALIDDPHSSNRTQILFLPMLAFVPAFSAIGDAHMSWVRWLSILPPTSAGVMPVRLLVSDVPWYDWLAALLLLAAAIWLVRLAAAKVFRLGMLMYGKEPTWSEVRRWIREA